MLGGFSCAACGNAALAQWGMANKQCRNPSFVFSVLPRSYSQFSLGGTLFQTAQNLRLIES